LRFSLISSKNHKTKGQKIKTTLRGDSTNIKEPLLLGVVKHGKKIPA